MPSILIVVYAVMCSLSLSALHCVVPCYNIFFEPSIKQGTNVSVLEATINRIFGNQKAGGDVIMGNNDFFCLRTILD